MSLRARGVFNRTGVIFRVVGSKKCETFYVVYVLKERERERGRGRGRGRERADDSENPRALFYLLVRLAYLIAEDIVGGLPDGRSHRPGEAEEKEHQREPLDLLRAFTHRRMDGCHVHKKKKKTKGAVVVGVLYTETVYVSCTAAVIVCNMLASSMYPHMYMSQHVLGKNKIKSEALRDDKTLHSKHLSDTHDAAN